MNDEYTTDARKRFLASRVKTDQPTFVEAFNGGYVEGIQAAWAAAEQLIETCYAISAHTPDIPLTPGGILEAFAEARSNDLLSAIATLDRRFGKDGGSMSDEKLIRVGFPGENLLAAEVGRTDDGRIKAELRNGSIHGIPWGTAVELGHDGYTIVAPPEVVEKARISCGELRAELQVEQEDEEKGT